MPEDDLFIFWMAEEVLPMVLNRPRGRAIQYADFDSFVLWSLEANFQTAELAP